MIVLLEDAPFLQEFTLLFVGQGHSTGFDSHIQFGGLQFGLVDIPKVSLRISKSI